MESTDSQALAVIDERLRQAIAERQAEQDVIERAQYRMRQIDARIADLRAVRRVHVPDSEEPQEARTEEYAPTRTRSRGATSTSGRSMPRRRWS